MPVLNSRRTLAASAFALLLALTLPLLLSCHPAPRYTITDLGVLPGDTKSGAFAINSQGAICGYTQAIGKRSCVFQNGVITVKIGPLPRTAESLARGVNAQGAVTGDFGTSPAEQAFVFQNGKMTALGTLPGFSDSRGAAINALGEVVGRVMLSAPRGPLVEHAFVYSQGKMTDLGAALGGDSEARSINSLGQVAGCYWPRTGRVLEAPFLYDTRRKMMTTLPLPASCTHGCANSVNDLGQAAGSINVGAMAHAALWDSGRLTDLGAPPKYDDASAESINNRGEVVGRCFREDSPVHTFLQSQAGRSGFWQRHLEQHMTGAFVCKGGKMQDLAEMIPRNSDWTLEAAYSINDRGQIVGKGFHHGQERAFLLTPR